MKNEEAVALMKNLMYSLDNYCGLNEQGQTAFRMAITALEERKKGKWTYDMHGYYKCSCCGITTYIPDNRSESYHFCRWCGAEMRGEQDEMC